jgi:hypothetical protein
MAAQPAKPVDAYQRAFCEAVERYYAGEWSPARPEHPQFFVKGRFCSLLDVCILVHEDIRELPDETVRQLFAKMHAQHNRLKEKLGRHPLYAIGSECLRDLMEEREAEFQQQEERRRQ